MGLEDFFEEYVFCYKIIMTGCFVDLKTKRVLFSVFEVCKIESIKILLTRFYLFIFFNFFGWFSFYISFGSFYYGNMIPKSSSSIKTIDRKIDQ